MMRIVHQSIYYDNADEAMEIAERIGYLTHWDDPSAKERSNNRKIG